MTNISDKIKERDQVWEWAKNNPRRAIIILISGTICDFIKAFIYACGAITAWRMFHG